MRRTDARELTIPRISAGTSDELTIVTCCVQAMKVKLSATGRLEILCTDGEMNEHMLLEHRTRDTQNIAHLGAHSPIELRSIPTTDIGGYRLRTTMFSASL